MNPIGADRRPAATRSTASTAPARTRPRSTRRATPTATPRTSAGSRARSTRAAASRPGELPGRPASVPGTMTTSPGGRQLARSPTATSRSSPAARTPATRSASTTSRTCPSHGDPAEKAPLGAAQGHARRPGRADRARDRRGRHLLRLHEGEPVREPVRGRRPSSTRSTTSSRARRCGSRGSRSGKVTKVEAIENGDGAARVTMEIEDKGLPLHEDAELKIRPRIFLEGNFFVDLQPGSPSAPELADGETIPMSQTAAPVQFGDLLAALQSDTRKDLQIFLREYSASLEDGGAEGFNASIPYWEPAYRNSAIANEASLGEEPDKDIQRILAGQAKLSRGARPRRGLAQEPDHELQHVRRVARARGQRARRVAAAPARHARGRAPGAPVDQQLAARRCARSRATRCRARARRTRRSPCRGRSSRSCARCSSPSELRGTAAQLRAQIPNLADFNRVSLPLLDEGRQLSACTNKVLVPFVETRMPDPDFPANSGHRVVEQMQHSFPNLAGESRLSDGNNQFFHAGPVAPGPNVRPAPPDDGGYTPPRAPPGRPVRDAGDPEPERARRARALVPGDRAPRRSKTVVRAREADQQGRVQEPAAGRPKRVFLRADARSPSSSGWSGSRSSMTRERPGEEGDQRPPGRLRRDHPAVRRRDRHRRLHPGQRAPALPAGRGGRLPREGRARERPGRHGRPGPDGARGGRARGRHRRRRPRGRRRGRRARARPRVQGPDPRGRHGAAAHEDGPEGHVPRGRPGQRRRRSPRAAASSSRTRRRTSTRTSSCRRSTSTRATTSSC